MKNIIISMGGSLVNIRNKEYLENFSKMISSLMKDYHFVIVVGGGKIARDYISIARENGENEFFLDKIGIEITRVNALLLKSFFAGIDGVKFLNSIDEIDNFNVAITGGTHPGHTTDAVALLTAEMLNSKKVINATTVDGIYDRDPKKYKDAKLFENISYTDLLTIFMKNLSSAGPNQVLDFLSIKIAERSNIEIDVINGLDIENFKKAIRGEKFKGTVVKEK
ncbi:MAG: UMP kinase [Thermoplasmata archaeon]